MSLKEQERLKVLSELDKKLLTFSETAKLLSVSERHVYRLLKRYHEHGNAGVIHGLRGKASNRAVPVNQREHVLKVYHAQYPDYGPTLFSEQLLKEHSITVSRETLRRWLRASNVTTAKRKNRPHRRKRERRSAIGEMLQFDGSPHDWFEGRGAPCCLLNAVDDASGHVFLRFVPSENAADVLRTFRTYIERHGIPKSVYTDHGSVFYAERKLTDFGRALQTLGVQPIFANSPQAKGRVERGNRTHQDRLIKALRQAAISTIADANRFLDEHYINLHNARFANCNGLADIHRPATGYDLTNIFCFQTLRQVHNDYTITLDNQYIQLRCSETPVPPPKQYVQVRRWLDDTLHIFWNEQELLFTVLMRKPKALKTTVHKPPPNHPWKGKLVGRASLERGGVTSFALRAHSVTPLGSSS